MWHAGARIVVGVSGGPDSVALLAALLELPKAWRPDVCAASLDHGLRPESSADVAAVCRLAAELGVPCETGVADVAARAEVEGCGVEAAARALRYAFLTQVARKREARVVAVGHHRDDQVETLLLRLLRGAGSRGLAGMRPKRPLLGADHFQGWLVRPLWLAGRPEVLAYLGERGLSWRYDRSNDDTGPWRNRVRHRVLPLLESEFGVGVRRTLARAGEHLAAEEQALGTWAGRVLHSRKTDASLDVGQDYPRLPEAVRARVLQKWWEAVSGLPPLGARHLAQLDRLATDARMDLPGGVQAYRDGDVLALSRPRPECRRRIALSVPGTARIAGLGHVTATVMDTPDAMTAERLRLEPMVATGDLEGVALPLWLRPPLPGERLQVLGAPQARPVREWLRDSGIPPRLRNCPLVVTDARGCVLWLAGARQSDAFRVGEGTRRLLVLTLEPSPVLELARSRSLS